MLVPTPHPPSPAGVLCEATHVRAGGEIRFRRGEQAQKMPPQRPLHPSSTGLSCPIQPWAASRVTENCGHRESSCSQAMTTLENPKYVVLPASRVKSSSIPTTFLLAKRTIPLSKQTNKNLALMLAFQAVLRWRVGLRTSLGQRMSPLF